MFERQPQEIHLRLVKSETLNLGCGTKHVSGAVNVDCSEAVGADVVCDLNVKPWPFPRDHFREVLAYDVLEHLDDFIPALEEIHRVCQNGAIVKITAPHYSCANAFADPTHKQLFAYATLDYVTGASDIEHYTKVRFRKLHSTIVFYPSLVNKIVWRFANRYPVAYERRWAWLFPAWYLYFELVVQKES